MRKLMLVLSIVLLPLSQVFADDNQYLTQELIWKIERIGAPVIAPQGGHIVAPVTRYNMDTDQAETRLWLFNADGSVQRPLTADGQRASNAVFNSDGTQLAFISQRGSDSAGQIYVLPMDGPGEANRITDVPTGVSGLKWVGERFYFISNIWPGLEWDEQKERLQQQRDTHVSAHKWTRLPYSSFDRYLDEERQAHVFSVAQDGGDITRITERFERELPRSSQGTGSYDISPNGEWIAFMSDSAPVGSENAINDIFLARIDGSNARNITEANDGSDSNPMFSPDGRTLAFTQQRIVGFYADTANIVLHNLSNHQQDVITEAWDRSASGLVWTPDSRGFYGSIDDAGTVRVYHVNAANGNVRAVTAETNVGGLSIANDGTLVATNESFLYPARLVRINPENGDMQRLDTINDALLADVELGTYESVTYTGHDGQEIQMWVHYPPGFDSSKEYPLFLLIHGGPHSAITDGFHYRWNAQTFASWGYVTAWHNFHGSSGFGQDFVDAINPDWITAPYADTIAAAQWFKDKDYIDNERLFAGGASYGGYLSTILLGREHPFNALLIHAPVYNMYSQMSADFAVHAERFGHYWDNDIYQQISPHYFAENFNTPALLSHGLTDLRVPVGQSFELFRTLQARGVESELIYFPDENHWILKPNNSVYWYNQVQQWVERWTPPGPR
ncbi:alpha/beta hydrolase family protein [Aliidiomarina maris]|uniref:Acyl-peptide hydrolase n=2 Tax=Aliidiomarina maris TaxID=531312 RepID=A0ABY0BPG6_9GAMM|nr:S9 family peptidase [Aliidiomarina maris]RUO20512.1 S9 family peptidase [Aliidiomarina maris]